MVIMYTQRGFLLSSPDPRMTGRDDKWYGSTAFNELYEQAHDRLVNQQSWAWRKRVIAALKAHFNQQPLFFRNHLREGTPLPFRVVDFLVDTFEYLSTGRRRLAPESWMDLIDVQPDVMAPIPRHTATSIEQRYRQILDLPPVALLSLWISQPDGLDDLITTCMIMFGDHPAK